MENKKVDRIKETIQYLLDYNEMTEEKAVQRLKELVIKAYRKGYDDAKKDI